MIVYCHLWLYVYGNLWSIMEISGNLWPFMVIFRHSWSFLVIYGYLLDLF